MAIHFSYPVGHHFVFFLLTHPLSTLRSSLPVATSAKSFAEIQREQEEAMQRVSSNITQAQSSVSKQATSRLSPCVVPFPPSPSLLPFHRSTAYCISPSSHTACVSITSYLSSTNPCPAASTTPPPTAHLKPPPPTSNHHHPPPPLTLSLLLLSVSLLSSFSSPHSQPSLIPCPG